MPTDGEYPLNDFEKALFGQDELGAVVRGTIYVEAKLLQLIGLLVKDETYIKPLKLDFSQHVNLAVALGLDAEYARGLRAFGNLRNEFAHKLDTVLSKERVHSLYEALSYKEKEIVQKSYAMTDDPKPAYKDLKPKDQFILIAVALHTRLEMVRAFTSSASSPPQEM
jgi:hypothetical protein